MGAIGDLLGASEFHAGLLAGVVGALVAVLVTRLRKGPSGLRAPTYLGLGFAVAAMAAAGGWIGFDRVVGGSVPAGLVGGIALVALGSALVKRQQWPSWVRVLAVVPGAVLVAGAVPAYAPDWAPVAVFGTTVIGSACLADLDRRSRGLGGVPLLFAISVAGVYATVPDTEVALVLLGAAVPLGLLGLPWVRATLGPAGAAAAIGVFAWSTTVGGFARPGSIVGALGALGLIVMEPLARLTIRFGRARRVTRQGRKGLWLVIVAAQIVLALYASRVAGFETSASSALIQLAPMLVVALLLGAALPPFDVPRVKRPRPAQRPTDAALGKPST